MKPRHLTLPLASLLVVSVCCSCSNFWRTPPSSDSTSRTSLQVPSNEPIRPIYREQDPARKIENNAGELLEGMGQEVDKGVRATKRSWNTPSERAPDNR